jgi:hypothetical protein
MNMSYPDPSALRRRAEELRHQELARIARLIKVEWSTLIHKIAAGIASGLSQWHAHARNLRLD